MAATQLITDPATRGLIRLIGGPGTGKTSLLVDAAAAHLAAGAHPESVLLLCPTARAAVRTRRALSTALASGGGPAVIREPLVRTLHSYAFAILRLAARRTGDPPPRLITGTEQDGIIRELLAGDLEDGPDAAVAWPESLRPALTTAGFATQLRDLLARCTERGVDGRRLQRIGRLSGRPEWVAAGQFAQQYEQVMLLARSVGPGRTAGHRARARCGGTGRRGAGGVGHRPGTTCRGTGPHRCAAGRRRAAPRPAGRPAGEGDVVRYAPSRSSRATRTRRCSGSGVPTPRC